MSIKISEVSFLMNTTQLVAMGRIAKEMAHRFDESLAESETIVTYDGMEVFVKNGDQEYRIHPGGDADPVDPVDIDSA